MLYEVYKSGMTLEKEDSYRNERLYMCNYTK